LVVDALHDWALRQEDRDEPVLRFLDGSALSPQDLLDEPPSDVFLPAEVYARTFGPETERAPSRVWTHLLNMVAVSVQHGEDLDEILSVLSGRSRPLGMS
jgi:hypothetical protein